MLDFSELGSNGRGLEQLTRELALLLGLNPRWSGEGPDGGRDLLLDEPGSPLLGQKRRRWVVSCKDKAASGTAVGTGDLDPIVDTVRQHGASGFLLVCTTHPSAGVVERLQAIESSPGSEVVTHFWDGVTLERLLSAPRAWAIAQRFMPVSTDAAGWKLFGTEFPNQWVAVHRGQYFHLSNRVAGNPDFDLRTLDERLDEVQALEVAGARLRVRGIWYDDAKGGGYVWYVDCMVPKGQKLPQASQVERALRSGVSREDGQFHSFDVNVHVIDWDRDHFDIDHYDYYRRLPSYV